MLLSGARGTTGVTSGRYFYEVRIMDLKRDGRVRLGFGTADANIIVGADGNSWAMDAEGATWHEATKTPPGTVKPWTYDDVIGIFVNLDKKTVNCGTFSVFKNGERLADPMPIPEKMKGKVLFPMVTIRDAVVAMNFGAPGQRPICELPFRARLLDDAVDKDVVPTKVLPPRTGKYDVIMPVSLPGEGAYDFLDLEFYPSHPETKFVEVSQRALTTLLELSGSKYGVQPELASGRMLEVYKMLASTKKRSFVVLDVKSNLLEKSRVAELTKYWKAPWFTKKAVVVTGTPPQSFTKKVKDSMVAAEKERLKTLVGREKLVWENEQKHKREARERKIDLEKKKAEEAGETYEEPAEEAVETPDWEAKMKVDPAFVKDVVHFRVPAPKDIEPVELPKIFCDFTLPVAGPRDVVDARWVLEGEPAAPKGGEGFDAVEFAWEKKPGADKYLAAYKAKLKVEEIYDSFTPTAFCQGAIADFLKEKTAMREHQTAYAKEVALRKAAKEKQAAEAEKPKAEEPKAEEPVKEEAGEKKEGDTEASSPKKEESGDVDMADVEKKEKEEEPAVDMTVDDDAPPVAISAKLDVENTDGKKTPLYKAWGMDDWILLSMRVELHTLIRAFNEDVTSKDPERKGITLKNLGHYYTLFFKKEWDPHAFGQTTAEKLIEYASDVVQVSGGVLTLKSKEALPLAAFVKETEKCRRDRENRLAMGDDSASLEFNAPGRGKGKKGKDGKGKDAGAGKGGGKYGTQYPQAPKGGKGYSPQIAGPQSYATQAYGAQYGGAQYGAQAYGAQYGGAQSYGQKRPADNDYSAKRPAMMPGYGYGGGYQQKGYGYGKGK